MHMRVPRYFGIIEYTFTPSRSIGYRIRKCYYAGCVDFTHRGKHRNMSPHGPSLDVEPQPLYDIRRVTLSQSHTCVIHTYSETGAGEDEKGGSKPRLCGDRYRRVLRVGIRAFATLVRALCGQCPSFTRDIMSIKFK